MFTPIKTEYSICNLTILKSGIDSQDQLDEKIIPIPISQSGETDEDRLFRQFSKTMNYEYGSLLLYSTKLLICFLVHTGMTNFAVTTLNESTVFFEWTISNATNSLDSNRILNITTISR